MNDRLERMRNIGISAHIDSGKTTLTERILFFCDKIHAFHEVRGKDGVGATMDSMELERERGITIQSASTNVTWKDHPINIIDTPGHVDFTAEVERSLRVLDGAVAIFCAVGGVEPQSETVWRQANTYEVPRIAYINKMDRIGADFFEVLREIRDKLKANPIAVALPIGSESTFSGTVDLITMRELHWDGNDSGRTITDHPIREELLETAGENREKLLDAVSSWSDEITELILDDKEVPPDLIRRVLREQTLAQRVVPVFVGASLKNIGVQPVLDGVVHYLPSPDELPPVIGHHPKKETPVEVHRTEDGQAVGMVFKIQTDREAGNLCFVRVYQGSIKSGVAVYNHNQQKRERVNRIFRMHANRTEQVDRLVAGEIGVIVGFKLAQTGDTIGSEGFSVVLERMHFPEPVISVAIEPRTMSERERLKDVLGLLTREDPTFFWKEDSDTGELIISGMGELHLDVLVTRVIDDYNVHAKVGNPQVTYRETILNAAEHREVFHKVLAGKDNHAELTVLVGPRPRGTGNHFENRLEPGRLPPAILAAAERGITGALSSGTSWGYPTIDIGVELIDAVYSEVTATEFAFEAAGAMAFDNACRSAGAVLLEPVMKVTVLVPHDFMGEVINGITTRGGIVHSVESRPGVEQIVAEAPLKKMFGYSTALRSATQGRGNYAMEFSHFAPDNGR